MDRAPWWATVMRSQRVRHDLATQQQQQPYYQQMDKANTNTKTDMSVSIKTKLPPNWIHFKNNQSQSYFSSLSLGSPSSLTSITYHYQHTSFNCSSLVSEVHLDAHDWVKAPTLLLSTNPTRGFLLKGPLAVHSVLPVPVFRDRLHQKGPPLWSGCRTGLREASILFQARVLEWVAISFSRGSSRPRDGTRVSHTAGRRFTFWATREALREAGLAQSLHQGEWSSWRKRRDTEERGHRKRL